MHNTSEDRGHMRRRECFSVLAATGTAALTGASGAYAEISFPRCTREEFSFPVNAIPGGRTIRLGMIGDIGHTDMILRDLSSVPNVHLTAYSNRSSDGPVAPGVRVYREYEEMLEREELDLAGICLPYFRNAGAATAAAERGLHVVMEKPVATTLNDLSVLKDTVIRKRVRLTALLGMRFEPPYQAVRERISAGDIGEPILATAQKSYKFGRTRPDFYRVREQFGGTIPWVGIHAIDYIHYTTRLGYTRVAAMHGNMCHPEYPGVEDHAGILFRLSNGGTAMLNLDYLRPESAPTHGDDRLRVIGSEGSLEILDGGSRVECISTSGIHDIELPRRKLFFQDFISELRGEGNHLISPEEPFEMTRVSLMARESAERGVALDL